MRKKRKKSPARKKATKRRVSRKRVAMFSGVTRKRKRTNPPMKKRTKKRSKNRSMSVSRNNPKAILENVLIGSGAFIGSFIISKFIDNKLLKVGASVVPVALSYFGMPKYLIPVSVGSGISALILGFQGYASPELKGQVSEWTGLTLGMDGDVMIPEETARLLLGAYQKALSGDSNGTPLSGNSNGTPLSGKTDYVIAGNDYIVSGIKSSAPLQ